jgi:hypothetical protein
MENWRRFLKENEAPTNEKQLMEKVERMDESLRDLAFGALLTIGSLIGMSDAKAGGITQYGNQIHTQQQVDDAGNAAERMAAKGGPDAETYGNAAKLLDYVSDQPQDVVDMDLRGKDLQQELGMSKDEITDAYVVAHQALDYVSKSKPKKQQTNIDGGGDNIPDAQIDQTSVNADLMAKQLELQQKLNPEKSKKAAKDLLQKVKDGNASASPETIKLLQKLAK